MSWWIWVIIIIIVLIFLGSMFSANEKDASSGQKGKSSPNDKLAKEIANEISTIAQFRALEKKLAKTDEKRQQMQAYDARSLKAEERAEEKYQVLQEAFDIASNKVLLWQFIPNISLETPLEIAKSAYKTFTSFEYEKKILELGKSKDEWYGLRGDEEPDEKDEEIKFIVKFRTIIENDDLTDDAKDKKINALVSRNKDQASNFFDLDENEKPSEQWRKISA